MSSTSVWERASWCPRCGLKPLIVLFCLSQSLVIKIINYHLNTREYSISAHWENIDHRRGWQGLKLTFFGRADNLALDSFAVWPLRLVCVGRAGRAFGRVTAWVAGRVTREANLLWSCFLAVTLETLPSWERLIKGSEWSVFFFLDLPRTLDNWVTRKTC